jgi:2-(3-amino-3-carboxypropyl)histidine synthase
MQNVRKQAIGDASNASRFGLILGTLGHQGSTKVMEHFQVLYMAQNNKVVCYIST